MSITGLIVDLSAVITLLGGLWWVFRLGQASGESKAGRDAERNAWLDVNARLQALEKLVADIEKLVADTRNRHAGQQSGQAKRARAARSATVPRHVPMSATSSRISARSSRSATDQAACFSVIRSMCSAERDEAEGSYRDHGRSELRGVALAAGDKFYVVRDAGTPRRLGRVHQAYPYTLQGLQDALVDARSRSYGKTPIVVVVLENRRSRVIRRYEYGREVLPIDGVRPASLPSKPP
jgi:hypothetical protein